VKRQPPGFNSRLMHRDEEATLSARRVVVDNLIEEIAGGGSPKERSAAMRLQLLYRLTLNRHASRR
jgi:hypothetical protein